MVVTMSSYAPLSAEEVDRALQELPGWHGDTRRLARRVVPEDLWGLLERVANAESDLDHHTVVDLDRGVVTFLVWTHARDAVTRADLELAARINAIVDLVGIGDLGERRQAEPLVLRQAQPAAR